MNVGEITLGALLHDLGKFLQRAHEPGQGLSGQSRNLAEFICPVRDGRATHLHALYTNEFVENLAHLPRDINGSTVANLAAYHHRPDTPEQRIIAQADRLSAGMERYEDDEQTDIAADRFRRTRLRAVAATVGRPPEAAPSDAPPWTIDLALLRPQCAFPNSAQETSLLTSAYSDLWRAFRNHWDRNRCEDPLGFVNRAESVLETYTWCIPAATNVLPDVSLYDHLKTTAAIAVCLFEAGADAPEPFLLLAGDLTGIQHYVFDIRAGAGGLARRLRGRSFNVSVWLQLAALRILTELGLPRTQLILSAGGKFHLLLPNTAHVRDTVARLRTEADAWLFNRSGGEIGLAVASIACNQDDLGAFSSTLSRVNQALREERNQGGRSVLIHNARWAEQRFLLPPANLRDGLCVCCGRNGGTLRQIRDEVEPVCDTCEDDAQIGRRLPSARYLACYFDGTGDYEGPLGRYSLCSERIPGRPTLIIDMDRSAESPPDAAPVVGQWWSRCVPRNPDGAVTPFDELADRATGRPALAYLKLDVDDMGWMFAEGLNVPRATALRSRGWPRFRGRSTCSSAAYLSSFSAPTFRTFTWSTLAATMCWPSALGTTSSNWPVVSATISAGSPARTPRGPCPPDWS